MPPIAGAHEVYAFGVIAPSTLVELVDEFPTPGGYAELASVGASIGGEAACSAYVLARLGVATKLAGNRIGSDRASMQALELLTGAGVDCRSIVTTSGTGPVQEVVLSHGTERTVLGTYRQLAADQAWEEPDRGDIASSRIVCLDPFFGEASSAGARWCRELGVPYVTVDATPDDGIARHAEVVIVSEEFATRTFGIVPPAALLATYAAQCDGLVILTRGAASVWFGRRGEPPNHVEPVPVEARDTTGAGDAFRAGLIAGLLAGLTGLALIRQASAVAALVCTRAPGVLASPSAEEVSAFLGAHP